MTALAHSVTPIRSTIYEDAMRVALSAGTDWDKQLRAAQVLDQSPDWKHVNLARHIRAAHSLHQAGLLKPVDPLPREKSDLRDRWREEAQETAVAVALRHADRWPEIVAGGALVALALLAVSGWL